MIRIIASFTLFSLFGWSIVDDDQSNVTFELSNDLDMERKDEPIVIGRQLLGQLGEASSKIPLVRAAGGPYIPSQRDDIDGDGSWDELAFLYSFKPNEKAKIEVVLVEEEIAPAYLMRTNIRLGKRKNDSIYTDQKHEVRDPDHVAQSSPPLYQMEGPAWENDKVGFRSYFDSRNGKDIFGKTTSKMALDPAGIGQNHYSYHKLAPWGMDILKVGNSLGAGALAMASGDSLIRLGKTGPATFHILAEGPVRSIFTLTYENWNVEGRSLKLTEQITLWAGQYYYMSQVSVSGLNEEKDLVAGMVNKYAKEKITVAYRGYNMLATHAKQSENHDMLGMAIITEGNNFSGFGKAPDEGPGITQTYYSKIKIADNTPVCFYFFAGWEKTNERFSSKQGFIEALKETSKTLSNEITITRQKS